MRAVRSIRATPLGRPHSPRARVSWDLLNRRAHAIIRNTPPRQCIRREPGPDSRDIGNRDPFGGCRGDIYTLQSHTELLDQFQILCRIDDPGSNPGHGRKSGPGPGGLFLNFFLAAGTHLIPGKEVHEGPPSWPEICRHKSIRAFLRLQIVCNRGSWSSSSQYMKKVRSLDWNDAHNVQ